MLFQSVKYILDLGAEGVWGECEVYEYAYTGPGSSYHPSNDVQAVMVGELSVIRERYGLTVRKVDSTNPNKGLPGARFLVASENGAYSKEIVTGQDGTYTLSNLEAGTYAVTELEPPADYTTGVFVSLDGGIDCLCTYPKRGRPPRGCRVSVRILGINYESNRIWGVITHMSTVR